MGQISGGQDGVQRHSNAGSDPLQAFQTNRRRNVLNVTGLGGALLPSVEDLLHALAQDPVPPSDIGAAPS